MKNIAIFLILGLFLFGNGVFAGTCNCVDDTDDNKQVQEKKVSRMPQHHSVRYGNTSQARNSCRRCYCYDYYYYPVVISRTRILSPLYRNAVPVGVGTGNNFSSSVKSKNLGEPFRTMVNINPHVPMNMNSNMPQLLKHNH